MDKNHAYRYAENLAYYLFAERGSQAPQVDLLIEREMKTEHDETLSFLYLFQDQLGKGDICEVSYDCYTKNWKATVYVKANDDIPITTAEMN